jgi:hypothetical protein
VLAAMIALVAGLFAMFVPFSTSVAVASYSPPATTPTTGCDTWHQSGTMTTGGKTYEVWVNDCGAKEYRPTPPLPPCPNPADNEWRKVGTTTVGTQWYEMWMKGCGDNTSTRLVPFQGP